MSTDALGEVAEPFPRLAFAQGFDRTLRLVVPVGRYGGLNHESLARLFHNRVSRQAVQHWRKGRAAVPQWARECVLAALAPQQTELRDAESRIKKMPAPPARGTGLKAWKARRYQTTA